MPLPWVETWAALLLVEERDRRIATKAAIDVGRIILLLLSCSVEYDELPYAL